MLLLLCFLLLLPGAALAQSGFSNEIGDTTFYHFENLSSTRQSIGEVDFYHFSNGTTDLPL